MQQMHPVDRVVTSYNRAARRFETSTDLDRDYLRAYLDGLGRALFDLTGDWPHQARELITPIDPHQGQL